MLKLIIIDDERLIRNGLTDYLDWAKLGIEISAVCANGLEGLEAIHLHHPDIVLTDIAMPCMDGVELLKTARGEGFGGQFIFISSYSEFRYAQEAVKYGAFDYLLKPLESTVLEDSVRRCIEAIRSAPPVFEAGWDPAFARDLLQGALSGLPRAEEPLLGLLKRAEPPYPQPILAVGVWQEPAALPASMEKHAVFCVLPPQCLAVILPDFSSFTSLQAAYPDALWRMQPCTFDLHTLLCTSLLSLWLDSHAALQKDPPPLSPSAWLNDLRQTAASALASATSLPGCWKLCLEALEGLRRQLERISPIKASEASENGLPAANEAGQVYELFETTLQTGWQLLSSVSTADSLAPYTRKVIAMIESRYGESLSLGSVAHSLGISKSHLSATFKADTGCTFSDYLFTFRMKMAKSLLEEGKHKIYEIAEQVGYPDLAQFSKRFKQYYGISPREMQKFF